MAEGLGPQHHRIYGSFRRAAAPLNIGHEKLVSRLHTALDAYVTARSLGRLWAGIEIVLDRREGIVLQPDITFIVDGRESIVSDRVWGPPDMVLEVTSPVTHTGQLEERVAWFSLYGVREYWLVQPQQKDMAILELMHGGVRRRTLFDDITPVKSPLFPDFDRCWVSSGCSSAEAEPYAGRSGCSSAEAEPYAGRSGCSSAKAEPYMGASNRHGSPNRHGYPCRTPAAETDIGRGRHRWRRALALPTRSGKSSRDLLRGGRSRARR